jgi:septal ring factor EnvC (AmiA/AmiB activator)
MLSSGWGNPIPELLSVYVSDLFGVKRSWLEEAVRVEETRQSELRSEIMGLEEQIDSTKVTLEELQQKMKDKEAQLSDCS